MNKTRSKSENIKPVRIALIGVGAMGMRWASALNSFPGIEFVAVADIDTARADEASRRFGVASYTSAKRMLADAHPDACVIVVPHNVLARLARDAFVAGCHVLLEKPGARTAQELAIAVSAARTARRLLMIGYNHRYFPGPMTAKKIVDSGRIGDLIFIRGRYGFGGRAGYDKTWRHNRRISGGGHLIDQGVHLIDLARWFAGEIKDVKGMTSALFWKSRVEDNAFVLLKHKSGTMSSIHASLTQWKPTFAFEVYGTDGYVAVEGLGRKYGGSERVIVGRRDGYGYAQEEVIDCDPDADKSLTRELEEFTDAIRTNRNPMPTARDSIAVLKTVEVVYRAKKK